MNHSMRVAPGPIPRVGVAPRICERTVVTVASFALGDYEWILALEADDVTDLVDLMRHLRATEARRHVREEVPFFTGRRIDASELAEVLS